MILILSHATDAHVAFVRARLARYRVPVMEINPADFPSHVRVAARRGAAASLGSLTVRGRTIALDRIRAVWWRRPAAPAAPPWVTDAEQRANIAEVAGLGITALWESLRALWVPAPPSIRARGNLKFWQLGVAREIGFDVPRTLVTNDPKAFIAFHANERSRIITKAVSPLATIDGRRPIMATHLVERRDLRRVLAVRHEPVITQGLVSKTQELRVTVVGTRVFAAATRSDRMPTTPIDWRATRDPVVFEPCRLPRVVAARCVQLTRAMGLTFGAIDLILTPEGRYVFLEINPAGQFGFLPGLAADIADALADLLARAPTSPRSRTT